MTRNSRRLTQEQIEDADQAYRMVEDLLVEWLALGPHLAEQSHDTDGFPRCLICGRRDELALVAGGWGGVWRCRTCGEAA